MTDMVPMYGFGGGQGGGRIWVHVDPGSQVTLTQTYGGKTKTAVADSKGQALFKGLDGGQWEAVATLNGQTAKGSTIVSLDYDLHLTYFSATINITYPAGLTCKATNGSHTLTAPDTSGTWACTVNKAGTWTITAGDWSAEADMTTSGQTETVRVARWIVKNGVPTDIGYSTLLVSKYAVTITPADGYINLNNPSGGSGVVSDSKVDISAAKMIIADVDIITVTDSGNYANFKGVGLALSADKGYAYTSAANQGIKGVKLSTKTGRQKMELDVENITGDWYIGFCLQQKNSINLYSLYVEV
nr:MAG TPA: hypothetical protein [Caudoviricetes sp.]DAG20293.1 MAG TPA: hypothetical protein [Caudoviricetes sp.]